MNHKKAMAANGMGFSPIATAVLRPESVSHAPPAPALAGTDSLSSTSAEIRNTKETIPAAAAAPGVLNGLPACSPSWPIGPSVTGLPLPRAAVAEIRHPGDPPSGCSRPQRPPIVPPGRAPHRSSRRISRPNRAVRSIAASPPAFPPASSGLHPVRVQRWTRLPGSSSISCGMNDLPASVMSLAKSRIAAVAAPGRQEAGGSAKVAPYSRASMAWASRSRSM
jgi:hypothetical protein